MILLIYFKNSIAKLLAVKWRVLLTYNVLWQQCFYTSSTSCSIKELLKTSPLCDPYLQTVFFNSEFYDVYRFLLISKQLVSLVRLASSYPKSKSVSPNLYCVYCMIVSSNGQ